jgi:hypothetical protein
MSRRRLRLSFLAVCLAPTLASGMGLPADPASKGAPATGESSPQPESGFRLGSWRVRFNGFLEVGTLLDGQQGFGEVPGAQPIARPTSLAGNEGRLQMTPRGSRLGLSFESPAWGDVQVTAALEADFLGDVSGSATSGAVSFLPPSLRLRHLSFTVKTPFVDVLVGQHWTLFGWDSTFQPASVAMQGLVGEVYQRTPQVRLSRTLDAGPVRVELAIAAASPAQRDSGLPDLHFGLRAELPSWVNRKATGATSRALQPLQVGVSLVSKWFRAPLSATSTASGDDYTARGQGIALDLLIPLVPLPYNALTFVGSYTFGTAYADAFQSLDFGAAIGAPAGAGPDYTTTLSAGSVGFPANRRSLGTIDLTTGLLNLQYSLPDGVPVLLTAVYSFASSGNSRLFGGAAVYPATLQSVSYLSLGALWDLNQAIRLGVEVGSYRQTFNPDTSKGAATTRDALRGLLTAWLIL